MSVRDFLVSSESHLLKGMSQWAKSQKKQSEGVRFFVSLALKLQCHIVKNTLLHSSDFSAIFPTGVYCYMQQRFSQTNI